jgi:hypothetical protein
MTARGLMMAAIAIVLGWGSQGPGDDGAVALRALNGAYDRALVTADAGFLDRV